MPARRYAYPASFALVCAAVLAAAFCIARLLPQATNPEAVAVGLTMDLTVFVPAVYYALLVRGRGWPKLTTVLVFFAMLKAAAWIIPPAHQGFLGVMQRMVVPVELLAGGYVLSKVPGLVGHRLPAGLRRVGRRICTALSGKTGWMLAVALAAGLLSVGLALRDDPQRLLRVGRAVLKWAVAPAELLITGFITVSAARVIRRRLRSGAASDDLMERWRAAAHEAFPVRVMAEAVAYEAALWHYLAQGVWRSGRPEARASNFSYHAGYGPIVAVMLMAGVAELTAGHLLLRLWSETAAWIHLALGVYSVLWLLADSLAARRRPHHVGTGALDVRLGMRWTAHVSLAQIASVKRTGDAPDDTMSVALLGGANVLVTLDAPVTVAGPYGLTRRTEALHLKVDEPERFASCLRGRIDDGDART